MFVPSKYPLDSLRERAEQCDYGVFVFTPSDTAEIRGEETGVVRDNVVLEFGLFVGVLGREKCFITSPTRFANACGIGY